MKNIKALTSSFLYWTSQRLSAIILVFLGFLILLDVVVFLLSNYSFSITYITFFLIKDWIDFLIFYISYTVNYFEIIDNFILSLNLLQNSFGGENFFSVISLNNFFNEFLEIFNINLYVFYYLILFYFVIHLYIGLFEMIEDYVHNEQIKSISIILLFLSTIKFFIFFIL